MKNKEFDKFIKSNLGKNLTPPNSLNWENMDIPFPQKKKKRGFFFMWIGLLGLGLAGSYFFFSNTIKNTAENNIRSTIANKDESRKVINAETEANLENQNLQQDIYKSKSSINELTKSHNLNTKTLPTSHENLKPILHPQLIKTNATEIIDDTLIKKAIIDLASMPDDLNKNPLQISENFSKENLFTQRIDPLVTLLQLPKTKPLLLKLYPIFEPLNDLSLDLDSIPTLPKKGKIKATLFVSFGVNISRSNFSSGSQVDSVSNAEGAALGNTYSLGWRVPLKKDFFIETGFTFQKLHTTFSHSEYLGFTLDLIERQKVFRTKHIFHNNYFKYLELNLGVGRNFSFGKNWGSEIILHFNPSYKFDSQGRTFDENQTIIYIEDFEANQKWLWSSDVGLNLFYQVKNNKIFTGVNFKQNLSKLKILENSNLTIQPQILTIKLGMLKSF